MSLSADRADVIKTYLIDKGINGNRITTVGLASQSGFYRYDKNIDGSLNEEVAARNRSIIIMDVNSEKAEQVLSGTFVRGEIYE